MSGYQLGAYLEKNKEHMLKILEQVDDFSKIISKINENTIELDKRLSIIEAKLNDNSA